METGVGNARRAGCALLALVAACGGSVQGVQADGGARHDAAASIARGPMDAGIPSIESDATFNPPPLDMQDSAVTVVEDCDGGTLPAPQSSDLKACWPCISKGCSGQIASCGADCECNSEISTAFACAGDGGDPPSCFGPYFPGTGHAAEFLGCMESAISECNCGPDSGAPEVVGPTNDAGCIQSPGGGSSGGGQCSSTVSEMCGGTLFQAACICPAGVCVCSGASTRKLVAFDGCPFCPGLGIDSAGQTTAADVLSLCGFP